MLRRIALSLFLATSLISVASADVVMYSNDFSGGAGPEWSDNATTVSNGEAYLGATPFGFGAGTDTLTLTGIVPHDQVTVNFDFYAIQSWDGNGPAGGGPDDFRVDANGSNLLLTNFANFTGDGNTQSYSAATPNGLGFMNAPRSGEFAADHLGFGTGDFGDATYRFSLTFASSASSLAIAFTSLQNQPPGDEGWGLDNVSVSVRPGAVTPEPSTLALGLLGSMAGLGWFWRRRRMFAIG